MKKKKMKTKNILKLAVILFAIVFTSCSKEEFVVIFNKSEGINIPSQTVTGGKKIIKPNNPRGFIIDEWYKEAELVNLWNFDTDVVTANITLYGNWDFNPQIIFATEVVDATSDFVGVFAQLWAGAYGGGIQMMTQPSRKDNFHVVFPDVISNEFLGPLKNAFWPTSLLNYNGVVLSDSEVQTGTVLLHASSRTDGSYGIGLLELISDDWFVQYIYLDKSFTAEGNSQHSVESACFFKKGWNIMYVKKDYSKITTKRPLNENFKWYFRKY